MPDLLPPDQQNMSPGPPPYTGSWTLVATRTVRGSNTEQVMTGIKSFELTDGIWFISGPDWVTAIPLTRWDYVTLTKDDPA